MVEQRVKDRMHGAIDAVIRSYGGVEQTIESLGSTPFTDHIEHIVELFSDRYPNDRDLPATVEYLRTEEFKRWYSCRLGLM